MFRKFVGLAAVCALLAVAGSAGAQELGQGKVLFEYWFGGSINNDLDTLKADPRFPDSPDQSEWRDGMDRPDWGEKDYWGGRGRAFLTPTESGDYTFWIASDDDSELWLSTDADPANAALIASVEGWTGYRNFAGTEGAPGPNQKSAPIPLVAGQKYYIEGLFSDGTGGGHMATAWGGPGIGDGPVVIASNFFTAVIRDPEPLFKAQKPDPADGQVDVTSPLFTWTAGITAVAHDVYLGTDPNLGAADYKGKQPFAMYYEVMPLEPGATYYWRVDETDAAGNMYEGDVWSFTVMPVKAYRESPYDGAIYRSLDTKLSWTAGNMAESHDVYLDVNEAKVAAGDPSAFMGNVADTSFDPAGLLAFGTTYYWRVDEVSAGQKVEGDVWSFSTTNEGVHGAKIEVWSDIGGTAVSDLTGNSRYPGSPDEVNTVADFEIPADVADNYGARLTAWLNVPVAGEYTFWVASDDASQLFLGADQDSAELIARVDSWAASRAWDWYPSQKSAPIQLEAGKYFLMALVKEGGGGDNLSAAWQGPAVPQRELIGGGFLEPFVSLWANGPQPAKGAVDISYLVNLSWTAGVKAAAHNVYLGTDKNAVADGAASVLQGQVTETTFTPAALKWNTTYYWRVDEVNDAEADSPWKGPVWSFTVPDYLPIVVAPETLAYDNTAEPFISEAAFEYDGPQNFTVNGVTSLQLEVKGNTPKFAVSGGAISLMGAGADIWDSADQFRYAYKVLNGDGSLVARVTDRGTGSNEWAKGGVMIRQSTEAGSTHAFMPITAGGGNGASFQRRLVADQGSSNSDSGTAVAPPYWVKIERVGSSFTGSISPDGVEWTQLGDPVTIEMTDPVLIGLAVTSHAAGELRTFKFDNISSTGDVTGDWTVADIGVAQGGNDPAPLYVALEDSDGKSVAVAHPGNPDVVLATDWMKWKIPLAKFSGVNLKGVTAVVVRVGDGQPDGKGAIQVRNVRLVKPIQVAVENFSFEKPGVVDKWYGQPKRVVGFANVPGWSTAKAVANSGVIAGAKPTNGSWSAYLWGGESPVYQTTGHTVVEGEAFQLDLDGCIVLGAINEAVKNFKISLYYEAADGKRVSVASTTVFTPGDPRTYSLSFTSGDNRKAVGCKIGIEFANVAKDNLMSVDNVRLKVK
jgi:hypothetical protein